MLLPPFLWRVTVCQSSVVMSVTREEVVVGVGVGVVVGVPLLSDVAGLCCLDVTAGVLFCFPVGVVGASGL